MSEEQWIDPRKEYRKDAQKREEEERKREEERLLKVQEEQLRRDQEEKMCREEEARTFFPDAKPMPEAFAQIMDEIVVSQTRRQPHGSSALAASPRQEQSKLGCLAEKYEARRDEMGFQRFLLSRGRLMISRDTAMRIFSIVSGSL